MEIIYAIPGIGTTKELFQNISIPNFEIKVLDWPATKKEYSLKEYAQQFLSQMNTTDSVYLMGVSFGGMLCSELADCIKTKKVVLISTCKDTREFPMVLRFLKIIPLHKILSEKMIRRVAIASKRLLGFQKSFDNNFAQMIKSMPPNYFSCCVNYIVDWNKKTSQQKFVRIHGTADKLLTHTEKSFHLIAKGSHLIVLNNAREINGILDRELNGE